MELNKLPDTISGKLVRDGVFDSMGMLTQKKKKILCPLNSPSLLNTLDKNNNVSCIVTIEELVGRAPAHVGVWVSDDPLETFFELHHHLLEYTNFYGENRPSEVEASCAVSERSIVASENIILHSGVTIGSFSSVIGRSEVGSGSKISSHVSIGANGFEVKSVNDVATIIKHAGGVKIGKNVDIHPHSSIDSGVFDDLTFIGDNVKIDSFVHVGHNVTILEDTVIASSAKLLGSCSIGRGVFVSAAAVINNHVKIGDGSLVCLGELVLEDVPPNSAIFRGRIVSREVFDKGVAIVRRLRNT